MKLKEYKFNTFQEVTDLGGEYGSEDWQRMQIFMSKLSVRTFIHSNYAHFDEIGLYYTRDQIAMLLGGRKWMDRLWTMLDAGIIERVPVQNSNNAFQQLYVFKPIKHHPVSWFNPVTYPRIINSLNFFYDFKAVGFSDTIRKLIFPNLRKLTFDITKSDFKAISGNQHLWNDILFFNTIKGLQLYDYASEDNFGNRVHTLVTRLPKKLRTHIRISGEKCIELDIHQCQVMLLDKILHDKDPDNTFSSWFMDVNDVYQEYMEEMDLEDRDAGKTEFCRTLFSRNNSKPSKIFRSRFPDASDIILEIKKKDHRDLARQLQRSESSFFRGVWQELKINRIPFLTVHDALIISESKIDQAYQILVDRLLDGKFRKFNIHTKNL